MNIIKLIINSFKLLFTTIIELLQNNELYIAILGIISLLVLFGIIKNKRR